jgi:hypothetical protein
MTPAMSSPRGEALVAPWHSFRMTRRFLGAVFLLTACQSSAATCPSLSGSTGPCTCTYGGGVYDCPEWGKTYPPCPMLDGGSTCEADAITCLACVGRGATLWQCVHPVAAGGAAGAGLVWSAAPQGDGITCQGP